MPEGSSFFNFETRDADNNYQYYDRDKARELSIMVGDPIFLWVGRMHEHIDPLTVLDGIEDLFKNLPLAHFYMIHTGERLLEKVKTIIEDSRLLKQRVHLLGKIDHSMIKMYYNSSDYFVVGSHYEGSVYALSEALRCGCVPIITNIPTFRMMTNEGQLGALWKPGDKNSFVEAATLVMNKPLKQEAKSCIEFFKNNLSFDAIAETAIHHYQKLIDKR